MLQFGRGGEAAETITVHLSPKSLFTLQFGRGGEAAETNPGIGFLSVHEVALQFGRGGEAAETKNTDTILE